MMDQYGARHAAHMFLAFGAMFLLGLGLAIASLVYYPSIPYEFARYAGVWLGIVISLVAFPMLFVTAFWWFRLRK